MPRPLSVVEKSYNHAQRLRVRGCMIFPSKCMEIHQRLGHQKTLMNVVSIYSLNVGLACDWQQALSTISTRSSFITLVQATLYLFSSSYLNEACSFPVKLRQKPSCRLMAKDLKLASVEAVVGNNSICCLLAMMVELMRLLALMRVSSTRMKV